MMLIRSALLLAMAMAGRLNQNVFEEGKIPCGCNNKVGLLAPKEKLEGIDIAPDAACAKPGVHASKTPGRFCSCDKGKAKNWNVAATAAQKRLDDALQPKIEALKSLMEKLQEKMGVEIDSSSIGKVKPKVTSFPREEGEGLWVCCCQSQAAGKCKRNAEMENGWIKRGVHHAAPDRACEDEFATETTAEVTEPEEEPQEPLTTVEPLSTVEPEPETEGEEEEVTGSGASEASEVTEPEEEPQEPLTVEPEPETEGEEEVTGSGASEASEVDAVPSPPAPPVSDSRSALLRQIQEGTKLKKTKAAPFSAHACGAGAESAAGSDPGRRAVEARQSSRAASKTREPEHATGGFNEPDQGRHPVEATQEKNAKGRNHQAANSSGYPEEQPQVPSHVGAHELRS